MYFFYFSLMSIILTVVRCYEFNLNVDVKFNFRDVVNNVSLSVAILSKLQSLGLLTTGGTELNNLASLFDFQVLENKIGVLQQSFNHLDENPSCLDDIVATLEAASRLETWALEMIDAIPKIESGILDGNIRWSGSYSECIGVLQKTVKQKKIQGKYCWVSFSVQNENQWIPFTSSVCIPKSCSENDIRTGIASIADIFRNLTISTKLKDVECIKEVYASDNSQVQLGIILCAAFLIFIILGTLKDFFLNTANINEKQSISIGKVISSDRDESFQRKIISSEVSREELFRSNALNISKTSDSYRHDSFKIVDSSYRDENQDSGPFSCWDNFLLCFSLSKNGKRVFDFTEGKDSLPVLNGIRVLSLIWIIISESGICSILILSNLSRIDERKGSVLFTLIQQWMLPFDSLLLISGCLIAFNFMKKYKDGNKRFQLFRFYATRYLRYTPLLLVIVFIFYICFNDWIKGGPISYFYKAAEQNCAEDFWKNFFYLHNFQDGVKMCPLSIWYFDIELQLFLFSPFLLLLFLRSKTSGFIIALLAIIGSSFLTGYLTVFYNASTKFDFEKILLDSPGELESLLNLYNYIYLKPYCRVSCFIIGLLCGYMIFTSQGKNSLNSKIVISGWIISIATLFGVVFLFNTENYDVNQSAIYLALSRPVWGFALAWIIYTSSTGNGGLVGELLSWNFWAPFSRVTYSIYLSLLLFEFIGISINEKVVNFSASQIYILISASVTMSVIFGMVIHFIFEAPLKNLAKLFLKDFKLTDRERFVKSI